MNHQFRESFSKAYDIPKENINIDIHKSSNAQCMINQPDQIIFYIQIGLPLTINAIYEVN